MAPTVQEQLARIEELVPKVFGFPPHKWQMDVIQELLEGKDIMVIAGTGSGKSLLYQAPVFAEENATCLILSPLISLINDQVLFYKFETNV